MIYEVDPDPSDECAGIDLPGVSNVRSWPRRAAAGPEAHPEDGDRSTVLYRLAAVALALASSQVVLVNGSERVALCSSCGEESPAGVGILHRPNCLSAEVIRLVDRLKELERSYLKSRGREDASTGEPGAGDGNRSRSIYMRGESPG